MAPVQKPIKKKRKKKKEKKARAGPGQDWHDNTTEQRIIGGYFSWLDTVRVDVIIKYAV